MVIKSILHKLSLTTFQRWLPRWQTNLIRESKEVTFDFLQSCASLDPFPWNLQNNDNYISMPSTGFLLKMSILGSLVVLGKSTPQELLYRVLMMQYLGLTIMPSATQTNRKAILVNRSLRKGRVGRKRALGKALASLESNTVTDILSLALGLQRSRIGVGCIG